MRILRSRVMKVIAVVVLAVAAVVVIRYPRQTVSRLTHWGGSPTKTSPLPPFAASDPPVLRLAAVGDIGHVGGRGTATAATVRRLDRARPFDALLVLGDNVYPWGDPALLPETLFTPYAAVLDGGTLLLPILGNHDVAQGHGEGQVRALGMPGRWYAKEVGNQLLFIGLDSTQAGNPEQRHWLEETLAAAGDRWVVVAAHHPPYSAGYEGSSLETRRAFAPLFERHGVELVLSGHDHDYQRSKVIRGVTYVVTGAASETRRTGREEFTAKSVSWHSFVEVAVFADRMVVRAVNQDGRMFDSVVLHRR